MNTYVTQQKLEYSIRNGQTEYSNLVLINNTLTEFYELCDEVEKLKSSVGLWLENNVQYYGELHAIWNDRTASVYKLAFASKLADKTIVNHPLKWVGHSKECYPVKRWQKQIADMRRYIKKVTEAMS